VFIGFPLLLLSVLGAITSRRVFVRIVSLSAIVFLVLSLSPTLKIASHDTGVLLPDVLLMKVPPFNASRAPVRFIVMGLFLLTIAAAAGIDWIRLWLHAGLFSRLAWQVLVPAIFIWTV